MKISFLAAFFYFLSLISYPVWADDSIADVTQSGIEFTKTDSIRMKNEYLSISPDKIKVEFIFYNDSDQDITTDVAFPMPETEADSSVNGNSFPNFTIIVDGKKIKSQVRYQATANKKDITADLEKLALPIDRFVPAKDLTKDSLNRLIEEKYYDANNMDEELRANYALQATYFWQQRFPAHQSVAIAHEYAPVLGENSVDVLNHDWKTIIPNTMELPNGCYSRPDLIDYHPVPLGPAWSPEQRQQRLQGQKQEIECVKLLKSQRLNPGKYGSQYLGYILATGANWKNGIESFHLHVDGAAVIFVSLEDKETADLGHIDIIRKDFFPSRPLTVEFMGVKQAPIAPPFLKIPRKVNGPANCRARINGDILLSIPNMETVFLKQKRGNWYEIDYNQQQCWMHEQNLPVM